MKDKINIVFDAKPSLPPDVTKRDKGEVRRALEALKVGYAVFLENAIADHVSKVANRVRHKNPEYNFTVRKVKGGVRVWRLKV